MAKNLVKFLNTDKMKSKWKIEPISVNLEGECEVTGDRLAPAVFKKEDLDHLARKFRQNFKETCNIDMVREATQVNIERLERLLEKVKFDYVVDGLNVAYHITHEFTKENITKVLFLLENEAKKNKRILQVLIVLRYVK